MRKIFAILVFTFSLLLFSGCSIKSEYNRAHIQGELKDSNAKKSDINVVVYTTKKDDVATIETRPKSFTGGANTLEVQTGIIGREITYEFFKQYFERVSKVDNIENMDNSTVVIQPRISMFEYEFDSLSNLGFAITPKIHFLFNISIRKNSKMVFSKTYDSGVVAGETYFVSGSPYESINKALHVSLFNLYKLIVKDIAKSIQ